MVTTAVDAFESSAACKPVTPDIVFDPAPLEILSSFTLSAADKNPSVVVVASAWAWVDSALESIAVCRPVTVDIACTPV